MEQLKRLRDFLEGGFITKEEYEYRKKQIIDAVTQTSLDYESSNLMGVETGPARGDASLARRFRQPSAHTLLYSKQQQQEQQHRQQQSRTQQRKRAYENDMDVMATANRQLLSDTVCSDAVKGHAPLNTTDSIQCDSSQMPRLLTLQEKYELAQAITKLSPDCLDSLIKLMEQSAPQLLKYDSATREYSFDLSQFAEDTLQLVHTFVNNTTASAPSSPSSSTSQSQPQQQPPVATTATIATIVTPAPVVPINTHNNTTNNTALATASDRRNLKRKASSPLDKQQPRKHIKNFLPDAASGSDDSSSSSGSDSDSDYDSSFSRSHSHSHNHIHHRSSISSNSNAAGKRPRKNVIMDSDNEQQRANNSSNSNNVGFPFVARATAGVAVAEIPARLPTVHSEPLETTSALNTNSIDPRLICPPLIVDTLMNDDDTSSNLGDYSQNYSDTEHFFSEPVLDINSITPCTSTTVTTIDNMYSNSSSCDNNSSSNSKDDSDEKPKESKKIRLTIQIHKVKKSATSDTENDNDYDDDDDANYSDSDNDDNFRPQRSNNIKVVDSKKRSKNSSSSDSSSSSSGSSSNNTIRRNNRSSSAGGGGGGGGGRERELDKPWKCDVEGCNKRFSDSSNLIKHIRTHTKEKPYECTHPGCGKAFAHSSSLKEHMNIHSGSKPYQCSYCDKSFPHKSNLARHERIHTGDKPFVCDQCGKAFNQSSNLKQHLNFHMKEVQKGKTAARASNTKGAAS